ncbi:MAG TPA: hypothetical protein VJ739_17765 [Gemmataceae bacterium]|nr:hypothetical protein [Gemmataceae bacterium]
MKTIPLPQPRLYFVNAAVDCALIGGASLLTFVLLRLLYTADRTPAVITLGAQLLWLGNWPHFAASSYRLYHTRANVAQYPVTALVIPFVVLAGMAGALLSPLGIAPYFVKVFQIWSPYHFSGQTLGITLIYARRSGFKVGPWERRALSGFIYSTFLVGTVRAEVGTTPSSFWGIPTQPLGLPAWAPLAAQGFMLVAALAFIVLAARWCIRNRRPLPAIVLLPAATQFVWFVFSAGWASYQEFVPFFHSLQYLLVAWSVQLKETMDVTGARPSWRYVLGETGRWGALIVAGGALLFFVLPRLLAVAGVELAFATGVVLCGVQIHHFFVDGVIWKLKNKKVAAPLMVNIEDLVAPARAA